MAALLVFMVSCAAADPPQKRRAVSPAAPNTATLDDLERRTFNFFWETTNTRNGLVPDRWPTPSFSSIAAVGFGLTAYGIGVERGYVTREAAAQRVLTTLQFFLAASQNPDVANQTSYKGFYYHFLDMQTGARFKDVELSTIDTTLLLAGMLFCQSYFDRDDATERAIRDDVETLYRRADWTYFAARPPAIAMGWTPENGLHPYDWRGYNEAMILVLLAIGSPTHPIDPSAWTEYTKTFEWRHYYGQQYITFAPLFGYQYSHLWIDFRGIQDDYMREKGIDYFENSRRATYAQRAYAASNPGGWRGYSDSIWGLTACDGPLDGELVIDGERRAFHTYWARGASPQELRDDGTLAPTAAISSIAFAPEIAIPAIEAMRLSYGAQIYQQYGFIDAFNPTLNIDTKTKMGHVVPGIAWVDTDYLGIDQGPIIGMIENYRSGLVWKVMKKNPHIVQGLRRAGFRGGWLDAATH